MVSSRILPAQRDLTAAGPTADPLHQFHPTQRQLARRLMDVIELLYSDRELARFECVDFRIFVPIFNQLVLQTLVRVLTSKLAPGELDLDNSTHLFSYHSKNANAQDAHSHLSKLRNEVRGQPRTLFLLIADECEWVATRGQGNDGLVSDAELMEAMNVVLLLVSATPEVLLSSSSRVELLEVLQRRDAHSNEQQPQQSLLSRHMRWFEEQ
jgi:hypothetical protein